MSGRKTKAQLQAELDAANKRCADLADALVKALMAQPVYVPYAVPYQPPIDGPGIWPSPWTYPGVIYETVCVSSSDKVQQ